MPVHAARRDHEMALEVLTRRQRQLGTSVVRAADRVHVVNPVQPERYALAEMTEHGPQVREAVEDAAADKPETVQPGLGLESVDASLQAILLVRLRHQSRGRAGVDVHRHP